MDAEERNFASTRWLGVEVPLRNRSSEEESRWAVRAVTDVPDMSGICNFVQMLMATGRDTTSQLRTVGYSRAKLLIHKVQGRETSWRYRTIGSGEFARQWLI